MARVVVVEPWYDGSHRAWLDGWRGRSRHDLEPLTLPGRFWRWRMRMGAVELAYVFDEWVEANGQPDAVVLSGLLDASVFCGIARRSLHGLPVALYMHENQIVYPLAPNQRLDIDVGLANCRSLLAVDQIWWNSDYHRRVLLSAAPELIQRARPDHDNEAPGVLTPDQLESVAARSTTLWPGVDTAGFIDTARDYSVPPLVLWNQRWDHDKNPRAVFSALRALADDGINFELALAGENQGHSNEADWVIEHLGERIVHHGWLEPRDYRSLLARSDVVVSAAHHEYFGIAIVEAIAAGAMPVLPKRLSFEELIEPRWHEPVLYDDGDLRSRLAQVVRDPAAARHQTVGLRDSMRRFDVASAGQAHDLAVDSLLTGSQPGERRQIGRR